MSRRARLAGALVAAGAVLPPACARPGAPPGGEPDRRPPALVATEPAMLAVVPDFDGPVVVRFDERLSERGSGDDAVIVSPYLGPVEVRRDGGELKIEMAGGWRPGVIWRVVVLPTLQDLFSNARTSPVELVFSTGPEIPETALAGVVTDRITGRPVESARVEATLRRDSLVYVAVTDAEGVFALRHIPAGDYRVRAFLDQNRNRALDGVEPRGFDALELAATDTALVALRLLPNDTTPARLVRAEPADSLHVILAFDDPIDPALPLDDVRVRLWRLPDSVEVEVGRVMHPWERTAEAEADALAADTAGAAAPARRTAAAAERAVEDEEPLPERELVLVPAAPLVPEVEYRVEVSGLTNIVGLPGGGGTATFRAPAPPPPDTVPPDPLGVPADTVEVPPESAPPDTLGVPADTARPAGAASAPGRR